MSTREYPKLTVNLLKEELKRRSLDQSGKKADLIARLENDDVLKATQKQDEVMNTNEDTNNTEEFNTEAKDLSEVDKPGDEPGFSNSLNNQINDSHNTNNNNNNGADDGQVNNGSNSNINTLNRGVDDNDNKIDEDNCHSQQQQQNLSSTTTTVTAAHNNDNDKSQGVGDSPSSSSGVFEASVPDATDNLTTSNHQTGDDNDVGIATTTTTTTPASGDDVTGSNNNNNEDVDNTAGNGVDSQETNNNNNNNNQTSSTTNDHASMDTKDFIKSIPTTDSYNNDNNNNPTTTNNADGSESTTNNAIKNDDENEAKSDNNEAERSVKTERIIKIVGDIKTEESIKTESSIKTENCTTTTTTATKSDSTTTTTAAADEAASTTSTTGEGAVVVDEKQRTEDDTRIAGLFCIEMRRDLDAFQLKWHGKRFTVPFLGEILADLATEMSQRSFQVGGLSRDDVRSPVVMAIVDASVKFSIDFNSNVLEASSKGTLKLTFGTKEECEAKEAELKAFKEDVVISKVKCEEQVSQQYLHRDLSFYKDSIVDRLLYVGNLPLELDTTFLTDLRALFPLATRLIVPSAKENNTARYVYLEYESAEGVLQAAEKHKGVVMGEDKLFVIKALCVRKERYGLLTDTLRDILLEKVRKMKRIQKNPWNKSRQELQEIDKAISLNMEKLAADTKHRKGWGMELGVLDETRINKEDFSSPLRLGSSGSGGRGIVGSGGSGGRGVSNRNVYENRRSGASGQRYGNYYGGGSSYGSSGGTYGTSRSGWAASNQTPAYYGSPAYQGYSQQGYSNYAYQSQQAGQQQQQASSYYSSANKRKSSDSYGSDWKRPRNF